MFLHVYRLATEIQARNEPHNYDDEGMKIEYSYMVIIMYQALVHVITSFLFPCGKGSCKVRCCSCEIQLNSWQWFVHAVHSVADRAYAKNTLQLEYVVRSLLV